MVPLGLHPFNKFREKAVSEKQIIQSLYEVSIEFDGMRLDQALSKLMDEFSRSKIQEWIKAGNVKLNDQIMQQARHKVVYLDRIEVDAELTIQGDWQPEAIQLDIVYEDDSLLVINKPVDMVVHPGAGNPRGTLVNALLHHLPDLNQLPRAGIIHRIDKDTTGLLVVAKTLAAHKRLVEQLQAREFTREYITIIYGQLTAGGTIDKPIGRHPTKRIQMAVTPSGKDAVTHYRIAEKFQDFTHLRVRLETGRTHQIRVHMAYMKHPIVGDPVYAGRLRIPSGISEDFTSYLRKFRRQALHAHILGLTHPETGEYIEWQQPLPQDMVELLGWLREENAI